MGEYIQEPPYAYHSQVVPWLSAFQQHQTHKVGIPTGVIQKKRFDRPEEREDQMP
jgi:hypothetical protein